jgi:hypothetical protein
MKALRLISLLSALLLALLATGCQTTESENESERPWNAQQGWQHGLPSSINQGR